MRIHATESGSQTHKTKLLLGSPLFLSIFSFIDSISIFVCYVPGTLTDSGKQNRPGRCPLEAHDFIDVRVQLSEDRYGLKGFLEMTVNRCTAFASYPAPMLWAMFAQKLGFQEPWESQHFRAGKTLPEQLSCFTDEEMEVTPFTHCNVTSQRHTFQHPHRHLIIQLNVAYSLWRTERPSKEVPYILNFSEGQWSKMLKQQLMWKQPKPYLDVTGGFSTIQRPGNENRGAPATRNTPLKPHVCLLINLLFSFLKFKCSLMEWPSGHQDPLRKQ